MTDGTAGGTPGWYLDRDDSALARWHDGDGWTEHTLVIADQEPGVDPPPPPSSRRMSDAALQRERNLAMQEKKASREAARAANQGSRYPRWVPVAVAVLVGVIGAGAFALLSGGDEDDPTTNLETEEVVSLDEAVAIAREAGFPDDIGDARASGLVEDLCEAAERPSRTAALRADIDRLALDPAERTRAIRALGEGAEAFCPDEADGVATAVEQLQSGTDPLTDTTLPTVDGAAVDDSATTVPDGTTRSTRPTTATTRKPTTGTTAAPAATTTTVPPTTTTTVPRVSPVQKSCSTEGAQAVQAGAPVTCMKKCTGEGLEWRRSGQQCQQNPTGTVAN